MRVLVATAELSPLVRSGGLGDAVAGLSRALAALGVEVTVLLPRYRHLADRGAELAGAGPARALYEDAEGPLRLLLVDDPESFDRDGIYGPEPGVSYDDEWRRWGRFSVVAAELAGDYDLVHLHDSHTAAAALLTDTPTVFTVHNAAYPVMGPISESLQLLGLGPHFALPGTAIEWYEQANYLKAGLVGSDQATTVSPGFARQLEVDEGISGGLSGVIRFLPRPIIGIMNGIDTHAFDPGTDSTLPVPYTAADLSGREAARSLLLTKTGLAEGFLMGMVGRVSDQKGFDLLDSIWPDLRSEGARLVVVGSGELDATVDRWMKEDPPSVAHVDYDEGLARLVFAAVDAYLMPSRFEPGGLGNIYAMRYGAPPLVHLTGGLADTVVDIDEAPAEGNGFGYRTHVAPEIAKTVRRAMRYHQAFPDLWQGMQRRGMRREWSWERAAGQYLKVYESVAGGEAA